MLIEKSTLLDYDHLQHYTLGDRTLACEILQLFYGQADVYAEQLGRARDRAEWHDAAHSLKGSARAIGAWRLAGLAEEAEKTSFSGGEYMRKLVISNVSGCIGEVKLEISGFLKGLAA